MPSSGPDTLARSLDEAMLGRPTELHSLLARGSRLPGPRINEALAAAFANVCMARGAMSDPVALSLARLSADEAPGATALEFLPVCGIVALSYRAAADAAVRRSFLSELYASADDPRFRVRDAVVDGLARIGGSAGDELVEEVHAWMDGYFHAAAVVAALGRPVWMGMLHGHALVLERLESAFLLARDAPRAAARYPGRKQLVDVLKQAVGPIALRFGVPVFDTLVRWSAQKDPELRGLVEACLLDKRLAGRFGSEVERVRNALRDSRAPVRNPDHDVGRTRDRSGSRRAKR